MIYTLTLNPSIDVTLTCDGLHGDRRNSILCEMRQAGGKGINVGAVIKDFGIPVCSVILCPKKGKDEFIRLLADASGELKVFDYEGILRENLTLISDSDCVKLNRKGPVYAGGAFSALCGYVSASAAPGDMLALCGSAPSGISREALIRFLSLLSDKGVKILLDSSAIGLEEIKAIRPFLIKPNIHELCDLFGLDEIPPFDMIPKLLSELGGYGVENILLSQGGEGMLALCGGELYKITVPKVTVKSTVGAGDSTLGGFMAAAAKGMAITQCLKRACACGTATVTKEGTLLCDGESAEQYLSEITIEKLQVKGGL